MATTFSVDETLIQKLPLPLAKLAIRAQNAKTSLDRYLGAFYLWESALKLLGVVAVIEYADSNISDPKLASMLESLARPSLGHWWEYVRRLVPILAEGGDEGFVRVRDLVLGRARDDMPRAAGLEAALIELQTGEAAPRSTIRLTELFDRMVNHRNKEIGHGAAGQRNPRHYDRMSAALLKGVEQILQHVNVLAGRRLIFVDEVKKQASGTWAVERFELIGESGRRIEPLLVRDADPASLPRPEFVYLARPESHPRAQLLVPLHPLVHYRPESVDFYFLNSRRGKRDVELLCYQDGTTLNQVAKIDQRDFLARILKLDVSASEVEAWAQASYAGEASEAADDAQLDHAEHTIGEYELLSRLGKGGMGVVYRAWQPSLGRQVALKSMLPGDARTEARFGREIRALGRVEHPNVIKIYTSGSVSDRWFYVMELIEGTDLGRICQKLAGRNAAEVDGLSWSDALTSACAEARSQETPLSTDRITASRGRIAQDRPDEDAPSGTSSGERPASGGADYVSHVVRIIKQVADAAHALHESGVVHRDIKPGNIMITHDGKMPVLMDLGLAQLADEADGRLTRTRQFVGTLRYASPEQILAAGKVDRRTDIYSLGATLWELLTLRPIFGATDDTPTPELMLKIQTTEPGSPRRTNGHVPRDLDAIVLKCLEKDRSRRYATAVDLAEDLRRFLDGDLVSAQPPSLTYVSRKFIRRHRVLLGAAALVALGLLTAAVAAFIGIDQQRREAIQAYKKLEEESYATNIAVAERELTLKQDMDLASKFLENCPEHLRGWEWHYLRRLRDGDRAPFPSAETKLGTGLWMAVFSPDGRLFATSSVDGTVRLAEVVSGHEIYAFKPHVFKGISLPGVPVPKIPATCLSFSPNGQFFATGSFDPNLVDLRKSIGVVKIWEVASHREVMAFDDQVGVVLSLAYSPDGQRIASSSINDDYSCVVWDVHTGKVVHKLTDLASHVHRLRYSPDGTLLASASTDGSVKLWDAATFEVVRTIEAHPAPVIDLSFSPDGLRIASAGEDGTVRVWETKTGAAIKQLRGHTGSALGVAFSPDGKRLASAGFDKTVRLWDGDNYNEKLTLRGHTDMVWSVNFSPDGNQLLSASFDGHAQIWDATPRIEHHDPGVFSRIGHTDRVNSVAFSPDGKYLASGSWDYTIRLWDSTTGDERSVLGSHKRAVWGIAFSPDGTQLASAGWDNKIRVWDVASGRELVTCSGHIAPAHSVAFSPQGDRIASCGFDGRSKVWDAKTGKELATNNGNMFPTFSVSFSPDGKRVATARSDRTVSVWDAASGREIFSLKGHEATVAAVAFSPDGKLIASGSFDHTARIWDADPKKGRFANRELKKITDHSDHVNTVAFSRDGSLLATGSEDKTAIVWNTKTWTRVAPPFLHRSVVWSVAFDPEGSRLATGGWSSSGWIKTWDIRREAAASRPRSSGAD